MFATESAILFHLGFNFTRKCWVAMAKLISSLPCLSRCFEEGSWSEQEVICANEWLYCNNVLYWAHFQVPRKNIPQPTQYILTTNNQGDAQNIVESKARH